MGHSSSLWYRLTASLPTHLDSLHGALGQPLLGEKMMEVSFSRWSNEPSGRCSGNGTGWGQPLEGCGELGLGMRWAVLHVKLCGGGQDSRAQVSPSPGWSPAMGQGTDSSPGDGHTQCQGADEIQGREVGSPSQFPDQGDPAENWRMKGSHK